LQDKGTLSSIHLPVDPFSMVRTVGFMSFYPGPGVGGHCTPLDPTYLAWEIRREAGRRFSLLEQAQDINERMPDWVSSRVGELLNDLGRAVKDSELLVLGVTYKADVGDIRESPSLRVMEALHQKGVRLSFHDFYVAEIPLNGDMIPVVGDLCGAVAAADCVLLLTPHGGYDLDRIADLAQIVFDTRNAYSSAHRPNVVSL
jgi:UDP-N-acetyl-D-glucosamine dehydrogenase